MEISGPTLYNSHGSIFEAILQECSLRQGPREEDSPAEPPLSSPLFRVQQIQMDEQVWSWLEEAPEELLEEKDSGMEDLTSEFKRVKSLREEQETKLAEFLREDARKSLPPSPLPPSALPPSPLPPSLRGSACKQSGSVSARKGKRIDKGWRRGTEWA